MRRPNSPYLEYGFYLPDLDDCSSFLLFVQTLLRCGSEFAGDALFCQERAARGKAFASPTDCESVEELHLDTVSLLARLEDVGSRAVEVCMHSPNRIALAAVEIATYHLISPEASLVDHHPLALLTDGSVFAGDSPERHPSRAKKIGRRAYERFLSLVTELRPAYANISFEYGLECPTDLRLDPRSYAFSDFYVSREYISATGLQKLQKIYEGAYQESVATGIYISTYQHLNPAMRQLDTETIPWLSMESAKVISSMK